MTIKDIAKECNVAVSTVSRVLNNHPDVSNSVREKVLSAVERNGYVPNNSARDLVKSSSNTIGVVVRGNSNLFFADVLKYISDEIDKLGYDIALRYIGTNDDEIKIGAMLEREKRLKGILFLGGRYSYTATDISTLTVPFVCCSYTNSFGSLNKSDYSSVSIDDHETAYEAVKKLINSGHRKIAALVPSFSDSSISELRFTGYLDALKDNGIETDKNLCIECGGYDMAEAYDGMAKLISSKAEFTAVFTISDMMAISAIKAMDDWNIKVPRDCSVIAIDGLQISEYVEPTLTTMVQPAESMGKESVRILVSLIDGSGENEHVRPKAKLREGKSVKTI